MFVSLFVRLCLCNQSKNDVTFINSKVTFYVQNFSDEVASAWNKLKRKIFMIITETSLSPLSPPWGMLQ